MTNHWLKRYWQRIAVITIHDDIFQKWDIAKIMPPGTTIQEHRVEFGQLHKLTLHNKKFPSTTHESEVELVFRNEAGDIRWIEWLWRLGERSLKIPINIKQFNLRKVK